MLQTIKTALTAGVLAAAVTASGAWGQTTASYRPLEYFSVELSHLVALPPTEPSAIGQERVVGYEAVLLSMPIAWEDTVVVEESFTVRYGGVDWKIGRGERLHRAVRMTGGNLATLSPSAIGYCGASALVKELVDTSSGTVNILPLVSRFGSMPALCVIDSDADGRFDKGFLVGGRTDDDLKAVAIREVAYTARKHEPIPGASLKLVYDPSDRLFPPTVVLGRRASGQWWPYGTYYFPDNLPAEGVKETRAERKAREHAVPSSIDMNILTRKVTPETYTVGNARFTIRSVNREAKTAVVVIDQDPTPFRFRYVADSRLVYADWWSSLYNPLLLASTPEPVGTGGP